MTKIAKEMTISLVKIFTTNACTLQKLSMPVGILTKEVPEIPVTDAIAAQLSTGYKAEGS